MPRTRKETQAEIQQNMEQMHEQIAQLTPAMQALVAQRNNAQAEEHEDDDFAEDDRDENPFTVLGRNMAQNVPPQEDQWEWSFKTEIPEFNGGPTAEELLDWTATVEKILEFKHVPLDQCVPVLAMYFRKKSCSLVDTIEDNQK